MAYARKTLLAVSVLLVTEGTRALTIETDDNYMYHVVDYDVSQTSAIMFKVTACKNAYVLLMNDKNDQTNGIYEILIGGWLNTKSVLRKQKQQALALAEYEHSPLACHELRAFFVYYKGSLIVVGEGLDVAGQRFLVYNDSDPTAINYFAVATGFGATGTWELGAECVVHGDPHMHMLDGTNYTFGGIPDYYYLEFASAIESVEVIGSFFRCRNHKPNVLCLRSVIILHDNMNITLDRSNKIDVNSYSVTPPYTFPNGAGEILTVASGGYTVKVQLPIGAAILWDGDKRVQINLAMAFWDKEDRSGGLCGTYTFDKSDDFKEPNRIIQPDLGLFVDSWLLSNVNAT